MSKKHERRNSKGKKSKPIKGKSRRAFLSACGILSRHVLNTAARLHDEKMPVSERCRVLVELEWQLEGIVWGASGKVTRKRARWWLKAKLANIQAIRSEIGFGELNFKLPKLK